VTIQNYTLRKKGYRKKEGIQRLDSPENCRGLKIWRSTAKNITTRKPHL
jgi:hypothetical protein